MNSARIILFTLISFNIYLLHIFKISVFDEILNIMISFGVFNYYSEKKFFRDNKINIFQLFITFIFIFFIFYRSFWLHIGDNFIYLLFSLLLITFVLLNNKINNIRRNFPPIIISLLFPITKLLFIPLAIIINPFSTLFTWLLLNLFGFYSLMDGQEIFYDNSGINITFSCSGAGQILFCLSAMLILNFCLPLKNRKLLLIQLSRAFLFTFLANILRLFLLAIFSNSANYGGFSMFDYLHGGTGGLFFGFLSMLLSCESYKRIYLRNSQI